MGSEVAHPQARPRRLHAALWLVCTLVLTFWLAQASLLKGLDAQIHDQLTRARAGEPPPADVVLVDIDEASLAQLGTWPWPRTLLAQLAQKLREQGARLQVWDLYFPEPATGDAALLEALTPGRGQPAMQDVVIGQVLVLDPLVQSPPRQGTLRPSTTAPEWCSEAGRPAGHFGVADSLPGVSVGHIAATPEVDGGLRRLPAVVCVDRQRYPQLALAAADLLHPTQPWVTDAGSAWAGPAQWLRKGPLSFALDAQGYLPIPYRRHHGQWPAVSALKVLEGPVNGVTAGPAEAVSLKGKVVVVGATALGLADAVRTPFHAHAPGASVHAELIAAAMSSRWVVAPVQPGGPAGLLVALVGGLLIWAWPQMGRPLVLLGACAVAAASPMLAASGLRLADTLWPVAAPTLGIVLFGFGLGALQVEAARRQVGLLSRHLESFLPRDLAREIARQHPSSESLGRPESGVVLAVRVVGLERWGAAVDSLKALGLVHAVSTLAERQARQHGGSLEHLQGETLLMAWRAAPFQQAVQQAVMAARALHLELRALLAGAESERHPLGFRAAVEIGPYLLAVAGSRDSRRSLMLGPAVDRALALLPLCEELASPLLMGEQAALACPSCASRPMGHFLLPDSGQPQTVFRVEP